MPKTRSVLFSALAVTFFLSTNTSAETNVGTPDPATMEEVFHYLERSTYSQTVQDFQPDALDMFLLISGDIIHADIDERAKSFLLPNIVSFLESPGLKHSV